MEFRIYRTWKWVLDIPLNKVRLGGDNPMRLVPIDSLQYSMDAENWNNVAIVEEDKPKHPNDIKRMEGVESIKLSISDILKKATDGESI